MEPERWRQIERLYHAALEHEGSGRAAFVEEACVGDLALRQEVESLLAQQEKTDSFLETPAIAVSSFLVFLTNIFRAVLEGRINTEFLPIDRLPESWCPFECFGCGRKAELCYVR